VCGELKENKRIEVEDCTKDQTEFKFQIRWIGIGAIGIENSQYFHAKEKDLIKTIALIKK
jgi:hypothetical protein